LKVLELFCGRGGWSKGFVELGHECTGIDLYDLGYPYRFIKADLMDWTPDQDYDIVLASPPCSEFSSLKRTIGTHIVDERQGLDLVYRAFYLIQLIKPKYWVIENVKGITEFLGPPKELIRYGVSKSLKAAALYGNFPELGFFDSDFGDYFRNGCNLLPGWNTKERGLRGLIPTTLSRQMAKSMTLGGKSK